MTLFPEMFGGPLGAGVVARAAQNGKLDISYHQLRDYADDIHRTVDDTPYGGGPGMVMKPEPLATGIKALLADASDNDDGSVPRVVLLSPQGLCLTSELAAELALDQSLILIAGRYEGVDERVIELFVDDEISIGDYVLTGGEIPAMVLIDAVSRFLPGVLGDPESVFRDSFSFGTRGLLQGPVYTRPAEFDGISVPNVLMSGDHDAIDRWRKDQGIRRSRDRRSDLFDC